MTVTSETAKVTALGNGATTVFSFSPIKIFDSSELLVRKIDDEGNETTLQEGTGTNKYTVNVTTYPGTGSITYPSSGSTYLASGEKIVILRRLDLTQETVFSNVGGYNAKVNENTHDRSRMIDIQLQEQLDRALKVPVGTGAFDNVLPAIQAGKYIKVNADGDGFEYGDGGDGTTPEEPEPGPDLSGTILLDDGTEDAPSHSFENGPSYGMWFNDADNTLNFSAGGNERVVMHSDSTGMVELSQHNLGYPTLRTQVRTGQNSGLDITGGNANDGIVIEPNSANGDDNIDLSIRAKWEGRLNLKGVTPFGIQVTEYGISTAAEEDQSDQLEAICEFLNETYGGGTLIFPQGNYYFTRKVNLPSNIHIKGEGDVKFYMGKNGVLTTAGSWAFDDAYPNARIRSTVSSGAFVWPIDTTHAGGVISRFAAGTKWRVRGAGGGDIEVRDDQDLTVASTDGVDDVTMVQAANATYTTTWSAGTYPEAAAYEALYGETDRTLLDKFSMVLLNSSVTKGVDQNLLIPTDQATPFVKGGYYVLQDDEIESDVAGSLKNKGNVEIVRVVAKTDMGANVTKLTLSRPVKRTYTTGYSAAIYEVDWVWNITVENIDFISYEAPEASPAARVPVVEFRHCMNVRGINLRYHGNAVNQLGRRGNIFRLYYAYNSGFQDCFGADPQYSGSGDGYIFSTYNSTECYIYNSSAVGGRHNFLYQATTDCLLSNFYSNDDLISAVDSHGAREVGLVVTNGVINQTERRSSDSNTSVAAIRLGNTSHPLGAHNVKITNIEIFGNGSSGSRGIDIVPPSSDITIDGVNINYVYDAIYARSNLDEALISNRVRIRNVNATNVTRYGIALLGDADAGFTGYQLQNFEISDFSCTGTNTPIRAIEVNGLTIKGVNAVGVGSTPTSPAFYFDDVLLLHMTGTKARTMYKGWELTDCVDAFIEGGSFQGYTATAVFTDDGGNTDAYFSTNLIDGSEPIITHTSASSRIVYHFPSRQLGKVLTADTYTFAPQDLGTSVIGNNTTAAVRQQFTIPLTILRSTDTASVGAATIREIGTFNVINLSGTKDIDVLGATDVTVVKPSGVTYLVQGKKWTVTIVRTGAATLSAYITEG